MSQHILVIDEGTTSTRAVAFTPEGRIAGEANAPLTQGFPRSGWVEHDAAEIWERSLACAQEVAGAVGADSIAALGLTNQRETVVFWDRETGEPLSPAIVWQDRRTAERCAALKGAGCEPFVQARTGLLLDPYFSATKIAWGADNWPEVRRAADKDRLAAGTVDAYLRYRLSRGETFETDATNAARTLLMDLAGLHWSDDLCDLFDVSRGWIPFIGKNAGHLGDCVVIGGRTIPMTGAAGDQQAAAIGQACFSPGAVKSTYGTGAFLIANAGAEPPSSEHRLLATLGWDVPGESVYALEGSIFVAGSAVQWLRDQLGLIAAAAETEALARSVETTEGAMFVPAFAGLGAPYWEPDVRGAITGLSGATGKAHIVRACLEAMGNQTADVLEAMAADGVEPGVLKIDGGMVANDWLCQDLADACGVEVERPEIIETTALGAAMLAAVGAGLYASLEEAAAAMRRVDRRFEPRISADRRGERRQSWRRAISVLTGAAA
ncbi:glycerol kinase [Pacificimonas flava]|uniref:glycerol kinase n=2 Tax=Pacificimonas TaxID=1960290 RepID=A0A219B7T4_9SPHN|nr:MULTISPECIES: glycerol kinase GlpK [Pacificimonas]MBZ6379889.1 glycerol kinase GlpK [Pacificimonas aurantium]OWV34417.1 glycerol kinase [Pacificimonas flava]